MNNQFSNITQPNFEELYKGDTNSEKIPHGKGWKRFENGDEYFGGFSNGKFDGFGEYVTLSKTYKYKGYYKLGQKHGNGKETSNIFIYDGPYINDMFDGDGTIMYNNKHNMRLYKGYFSHGKICGNGYAVFSDKSIITGSFDDNIPNGKIRKKCENYTFDGHYLKGELDTHYAYAIIYKNGNSINHEISNINTTTDTLKIKEDDNFISTHKIINIHDNHEYNPMSDGFERGKYYDYKFKSTSMTSNGIFVGDIGLKMENNQPNSFIFIEGTMGEKTMKYLRMSKMFVEFEEIGKLKYVGKITYENGNTYTGEFIKGYSMYNSYVPNGPGKMKYFDGDIYEGHFRDGSKCSIKTK